jgi:DTW domain-containing protein YfiP
MCDSSCNESYTQRFVHLTKILAQPLRYSALRGSPLAHLAPAKDSAAPFDQGAAVADVAQSVSAEETCPKCLKLRSLCVCDEVVPIDNRIALLVLQHPQEQDKTLGTARLTVQSLTNAVFRIGLSWPSLAKALGRPAEPRHWAVVYLGATRPADFPPGREIAVFDKKGGPVADQDAALAGIKGVIVLDGTWSQAKTLWWRNPWVLKAKRIALKPRRPSLYGRLRREPRREGLSTLEAAALVLARLEDRPEIEAALTRTFARMLDRYRQALARPAHSNAPSTEVQS